MKVLVTGASGFLGSYFTETLDLRAASYARYDHEHPEIPGDIDTVVHFGGYAPTSPTGVGDDVAALYREANVEGTKKLLDSILAQTHLTRFVNIGSTAELGLSREPADETAVPAPVGLYGASKLEQTKLVEAFAREHGVKTVNLRLFNVVGVPKTPRAAGDVGERSLFERLKDEFNQSPTPTLHVSDSGSVRDYIDPRDVAEAAWRAANSEMGDTYELVNICSGIPTTNGQVIELFAKTLGKHYTLETEGKEPTYSIGVGDKARRLLGFAPALALSESIEALLRI